MEWIEIDQSAFTTVRRASYHVTTRMWIPGMREYPLLWLRELIGPKATCPLAVFHNDHHNGWSESERWRR